MAMQSLSHVYYHPHILILFRCMPRGFTIVHLHIAGIAGRCITYSPYLYALFGWFAWHVLFEWTAVMKLIQGMVHGTE